jgi:outer membrane protein TolC
MHLRILIPPICVLLASFASAETPVRTLGDAYARALAASETIAINEQSVRQAEALYREAFGSSFPLITARTLTTWQDGARGQSQTDAGLRLTQTNLTGYRELMAVRAAKATSEQREADRLRAEQLLLNDVAGAFYGLEESLENVAVTAQLAEFARLRLKELNERTRVGRGREADAIAQEVQLAALESQAEESRRQVSARTDLLAYLTLTPRIEPQVSSEPARGGNAELASYLARRESRPDVASARKAAESAADRVHVARADRVPQLSLLADWYAGGYRPASRSALRWDGQLIASLPLFSFGAISAEVDAAKAFSTSEELFLHSTRRSAELDIKNAFRDDVSARTQLEVQTRAVALAERDYALQRRDERRGSSRASRSSSPSIASTRRAWP